MAQTGFRKWKKKISAYELELLVNGVSASKDSLFSNHTDVCSNNKKTKSWGEINNQIDFISNVGRNNGEVRSKWADWSSTVKKKASSINRELKQTGGGEAPKNLSDIEECVLAVIGKTTVDGIITERAGDTDRDGKYRYIIYYRPLYICAV